MSFENPEGFTNRSMNEFYLNLNNPLNKSIAIRPRPISVQIHEWIMTWYFFKSIDELEVISI